MQQTFLLTPDELFSNIFYTVRINAEYRLTKGKPDSGFKIYYSEKAIILNGEIISTDNRTALHLEAMSPICIISDNYELSFLKIFFGQLEKVIRCVPEAKNHLSTGLSKKMTGY
jgi:hypothetical protein